MSGFSFATQLIYVLAASCFVLGLHLMNTPATARRGNQFSTAGMVIAIATTLALIVHAGVISATGWVVMLAGALIGGARGPVLGAHRADDRDAAAGEHVQRGRRRRRGAGRHPRLHPPGRAASGVAESTTVTTLLDVIIGSVTFSGSIIAAGKLQGVITSAPVTFPGARAVNLLLAALGPGRGRVRDRHAEPARAVDRDRRGARVRRARW